MSSLDNTPIFGKPVAGVTYETRPGAYGFLFNENSEMAIVETSHGLFLPGGGLDPGETDEAALARELLEEIGYELIHSKFELRAVQFHWSTHYQKHFKKIGSFYSIEAKPIPGAGLQAGHSLLWMPAKVAAKNLAQEFQRWAVTQKY